MSKQTFPKGWDESRVQNLIQDYESQSEEAAVAEDEAAFEDPDNSFLEVPKSLVPEVRKLLAAKKQQAS